jgi:hypothetical protein
MGLLRFLVGPSYSNGEIASNEYHRQGGEPDASGETIESIARESGIEPDENFYAGWRDADENRKGFWQWVKGE